MKRGCPVPAEKRIAGKGEPYTEEKAIGEILIAEICESARLKKQRKDEWQ